MGSTESRYVVTEMTGASLFVTMPVQRVAKPGSESALSVARRAS